MSRSLTCIDENNQAVDESMYVRCMLVRNSWSPAFFNNATIVLNYEFASSMPWLLLAIASMSVFWSGAVAASRSTRRPATQTSAQHPATLTRGTVTSMVQQTFAAMPVGLANRSTAGSNRFHLPPALQRFRLDYHH